jgi:SPASM domain peptide maturase of grasp-with-spasm system
VKGSERSVIYDLSRQKLRFIPNSLYELIRQFEHTPFREVRTTFSGEDLDIFDQYLAFLVQEDVGFFTDTPELFPALPLDWHTPGIIQQAVVQYAFAAYDIREVVQALHALHCRHLELRLSQVTHVDDLHRLMRLMDGKIFKSVSVFIGYSPVLTVQEVEALFANYGKIASIIVYNAPFAYNSSQYTNTVLYTECDFEQSKFREHFPTDYYIVNVEYFTEAQRYNPYYNKKVCIDASGAIKNCLLQSHSFGNVNTTSLQTVVTQTDFQELWHAAPDTIEGVRDSELRYCMLISHPLEKLHDGTYRIRTQVLPASSTEQEVWVSDEVME